MDMILVELLQGSRRGRANRSFLPILGALYHRCHDVGGCMLGATCSTGDVSDSVLVSVG
jgi:hypothetical protein